MARALKRVAAGDISTCAKAGVISPRQKQLPGSETRLLLLAVSQLKTFNLNWCATTTHLLAAPILILFVPTA